MKLVQRFLIAMSAMLIFILTTGAAQADVPDGGFKVTSDTLTGTTLEFGSNASFGAIKAKVGDQFKEYYGRELDDASVQAAFPDKIIPACIKTDGGRYQTKYYGVNNTRPWTEDCKTSGVKLAWFIIGTQITFPKVPKPVVGSTAVPVVARPRILTYEEKEALRDEKCSCFDKKECLIKRLGELGVKTDAKVEPTSTPPSATPGTQMTTVDAEALKSTNAKVADLEKQLAQAKQAPAPATVVTFTSQRPQWPLPLLVFTLCLGGFIVFYGMKHKPTLQRVTLLAEASVKYHNHLDAMTQERDAAIPAKIALEALATEFGFKTEGGPFRSNPELTHDDIAEKIRKMRSTLVDEVAKAQGELTKSVGNAQRTAQEMQAKIDAALKRAAEAERSAAHQSAVAEQRLIDGKALTHQIAELGIQVSAQAGEIAQAKDREKDAAKKRSRFEQLCTDLSPMFKDLIRISLSLQHLKVQHAVRKLHGQIYVSKNEPIPAELQAEIETDEIEATSLREQVKKLQAHMRPWTKEKSAIRLQLLGSKDPEAALSVDIIVMHEEAETVLAAARSVAANADNLSQDIKRDRDALLVERAESTEEKEKLANEVREHQERKDALGKREEDLASERSTFDEHRRAENTSIANRKAAVNQLLDEACIAACLEPGMSVEAILQLGGVSGLLGDLTKTAQGESKKVAELTKQLADLRAAQEALDEARMELATRRSESALPVANDVSDAEAAANEERFSQTNDYVKLRESGRHGPTTQSMLGAVTTDDDNPLDCSLEELRAAQALKQGGGRVDTQQGMPMHMMDAIKSQRPPPNITPADSSAPTNGTPPRKNTLDGIAPPTSILQSKIRDLSDLVHSINGYMDTSLEKPILDRRACAALFDFMHRRCELSRELLESSPHARLIFEKDPARQDPRINALVHGLTVERLRDNTRKLEIVFPKKTLPPPAPMSPLG